MQTKKVCDYGCIQTAEGAEEYVFALSEGKEVAVDARFYAEAAFSVFYRSLRATEEKYLDIPVAANVTEWQKSDRVTGVVAIVVWMKPKVRLFHSVHSKAIGIAPMDTTPVAIASRMPELSVEDRVRREWQRLNGPKPRRSTAEEIGELEDDEIVTKTGGKNFEIPDDDPDFPDEFSREEVRAMLADYRARRMQQGDAERNPPGGGNQTGKDRDTGSAAPSAGAGADDGPPVAGGGKTG